VRRRLAVPAEELRRVYRDHVDAVYAYLAYSVDRGAAEDLTAATFERVVRSWGRFDARRGSERTWVLAIARNLLTDHFRAGRHRTAVSTDEHPGLLDRLVDDGEPLAAQLTAEELARWLAPLGQREREILALRYAADLTTAEIAGMLGLTDANVQQINSRSLRRLRALFESHGNQGQRLT
jgi:RNA polymerase sigma factor (sigma-70 family)